MIRLSNEAGLDTGWAGLGTWSGRPETRVELIERRGVEQFGSSLGS